MKYRAVWSGRTARECSTAVMEFVDEAHWDNYFYITLCVIDWDLCRIIREIDVPIDEVCGWPPNIALERIGSMLEDLETLLNNPAADIDTKLLAPIAITI